MTAQKYDNTYENVYWRVRKYLQRYKRSRGIMLNIMMII